MVEKTLEELQSCSKIYRLSVEKKKGSNQRLRKSILDWITVLQTQCAVDQQVSSVWSILNGLAPYPLGLESWISGLEEPAVRTAEDIHW